MWDSDPLLSVGWWRSAPSQPILGGAKAVGHRIEVPDDPSQQGRLGSHRACRPSRADRPWRRVPVRSRTAGTSLNPPDGPANRRWGRRSRDERRHGDRDGRGCTDQSNRIAMPRPRLTGRTDPTKRTQDDRGGKEDSDGRDRTGLMLSGGARGSDETNPGRSGWQGSHRLKQSYQCRDRRWGGRIRRNEPRTIGVAGITPIAGASSRYREEPRDRQGRETRVHRKNATAFPLPRQGRTSHTSPTRERGRAGPDPRNRVGLV